MVRRSTAVAILSLLGATAGCTAATTENVGIDEGAIGSPTALSYLEAHKIQTFDDLLRSGAIVLTPEQEAERAAKGFVLGAVPDALLPVVHAHGSVIEMTSGAMKRVAEARARQAAGQRHAVFEQQLAEKLFDPRDEHQLEEARDFANVTLATTTAIACPVGDAPMPDEWQAPDPEAGPDTTNIDLRAALLGSPAMGTLVPSGSMGMRALRPQATTDKCGEPAPCKFRKSTMSASKDGSQSWVYANVADDKIITPAETQQIKDKKLEALTGGTAAPTVDYSVEFTLTFSGKCEGEFTANNGPLVRFSNTTTTSALAINATVAKGNNGSVALDVIQQIDYASSELGAGGKKVAPMKLVAKMGSTITKTETKGTNWKVGSGTTANNQATGSGGVSGGKSGGQKNLEGKFDGMYTQGGTTTTDISVDGSTHDTYVYSPADTSIQATNRDSINHGFLWHGEFGQAPEDADGNEVVLKFDVKWSSAKFDAAHGGTGKADYRTKVTGTEEWSTKFTAKDVRVKLGKVTIPDSVDATSSGGGGGDKPKEPVDPRSTGPIGP